MAIGALLGLMAFGAAAGAGAAEDAAVPPPAGNAAGAEARRHYEEGTKAFNLGDYPRAITEADLEEDHMEAVSALLRDMEDCDTDIDEPHKQLRFDLCHECHKRFIQDPLGKDNAHKLFFSKN